MKSYELTEDEKAAALKEAQERKEKALRYEEDLERRRITEQIFLRPWTPKELAIYLGWKAEQDGLPFQIDERNHAVVKVLCRYFTGDKGFASSAQQIDKYGQEFSLSKGILLCGPLGTGKTTLMKLFRGNQKRSYQVVSCRQLADQFKKDGEQVLHLWSRPLSVPTQFSTFYQNQIGVCFDDLGTEGVKRNFGDQVNVMAEIISNRYDHASVPFHWTHVTTNLTAGEIQDYYGERVRSRMREMFNMFELTGEDRRK